MLIIYAIVLTIALLLMIDNTFLKIFYSSSSITGKTAYLGRINLLCTIPFFPLVGMVYIFRCSVQGVGNSLFPLLGGIGELLARTLICIFGPYIFVSTISTSLDLFASPWPYIVTCLADPLAWLAADVCMLGGYILHIYKPYKKYLKTNEITFK